MMTLSDQEYAIVLASLSYYYHTVSKNPETKRLYDKVVKSCNKIELSSRRGKAVR